MSLFSKKEYKGTLVWENIKNENGPYTSRRTKITGGWLFYSTDGIGSGVTFIPDPEHKWNGNSK
jgi:hypothetical protein